MCTHTDRLDEAILMSTNNIHFHDSLRKHAYSNIIKLSPPKSMFSDKKADIFHISTQNIDCAYSLEPPHRSGSNEYPQSMFLRRNKKIMYTPVNSSSTI